VKLLDDPTLKRINDIIVEMGHELLKKKEMEVLRLKSDTFVVESNIHFPTDINLLWDSGRKCLDVIGHIIKEKKNTISGWRKIKNWKKDLKNKMRSLSRTCSVGGKNKPERIIIQAKQYIKKAKSLSKKVSQFIESCQVETNRQLLKLIQLGYFLEMLDKHIDLVKRRLIKGEKIPSEEKIYSIFETYTEWITKGKLHPNVELGKKILVTTDQYHLIVDYEIVTKQADVKLSIPLVERLIEKFCVQSLSFDKGFWKKEHKELLSLYIPEMIMPKKGKPNQKEKAEEGTKKYKKLRNQHSAVESNINQLEYNGLDRCPDRGEHGFNRYIGLGVIAYNLHRIGKYLLEKDKQAKQNKGKDLHQAA
jgi:hypothetical protein